MTEQIAKSSPRFTARIAGAFYLVLLVSGIFAQAFVSEKLIVLGDAAATATNISTNKGWFQLGFTVYLIEMACQIALTALLYILLKPAGKSMSLIAAYIGLAGCVIKTFSRVFYIIPLFILGGSPSLNAFTTEQRQELALVFLQVNDQGPVIALAFFGFATLLQGYLILRSTFLPRFLGVLSIMGGVGLLSFLYPPLGYRLFPYIALVVLLGSVSKIFWLLVYGVNEQRWKEQAGSMIVL